MYILLSLVNFDSEGTMNETQLLQQIVYGTYISVLFYMPYRCLVNDYFVIAPTERNNALE